MILEALDAEQMADYADRRSAMVAAVTAAAPLASDSRRKFMTELGLEMEHTQLIRTGDVDAAAEHRFNNSSLAAETVHGLMAEAGLLGDRSHDDEDPDDEYEPPHADTR